MRNDALPRAIERVAEQRIEAAMQRGEFDRLEGSGKPIAGVDAGYDDLWWIREWIKRENASAGVIHRELRAALRTMRAQRDADNARP